MSARTRISDEEALALFESGEGFDPATARDRSETDDIRAAVKAREAAKEDVDRVVIKARKRGLTWIEIGLALGVSPQAARKKYVDRV